MKEQLKGAGQEAKGEVKEAAGRLTGNRRLQAEGYVEKKIGKVRRTAARPMEAMKGSAQEVKGTLKRSVGEGLDDPDLASEGEAERVTGKVRRKLNE